MQCRFTKKLDFSRFSSHFSPDKPSRRRLWANNAGSYTFGNAGNAFQIENPPDGQWRIISSGQDAGQTKDLETQSVFPQSTSVETGFPLLPSQPKHGNTLFAGTPLLSRQLQQGLGSPPTHSTTLLSKDSQSSSTLLGFLCSQKDPLSSR